MFVINTTFCTEPALAPDLLAWCRTKYIPRAESYGFTGVQLCKILNTAEDPADAESYALQMQSENIKLIDEWLDSEGAELLGECMTRWQKRVLPFMTYMDRLY